VPFVLWASLWRTRGRSPHAASYLPVRHLYRHADAIGTYGPHVSAYVRSKGAVQTVVEAPQSVDNEYWNGQSPQFGALLSRRRLSENRRGKRHQVLIQAWSSSGCRHSAPRWFWSAAVRSEPGPSPPARSCPKASLARRSTQLLRGSDVVVVPSVPTRDFREPWGLVVNEAFNQGVPVIASDAVGAVAGGLVRHERTGLVVPAGDVPALAAALRRCTRRVAAGAAGGGRARGGQGLHARRVGGRSVKRACGRGEEPLLAWTPWFVC
jgi:hypothetical protein